jgi:putative transposase
LKHVIILGESHLRKILGRHFHYYHKYRTRISLEKDAPEPRPIQAANLREIVEIPEVGGLHHHYERRAA